MGSLIYTDLQLPADPATGKIISGDMALHVHQAMANVQAALRDEGCKLRDILQIRIYVTDMSPIEDIRSVLRGYLAPEPPAMSLIQVPALPQGATVAVEAVALRPAP
jgi:2-iminobutanoate/2-iminopropanoate deaminase